MNLDELVQSIPDDESTLRTDLAHWVEEWKQGTDSIDKLSYMIGKWHSNVWFKDTEASNAFGERFRRFRIESIEKIDSMTVNEKLFSFGLFPQWDAANDLEKIKIRERLQVHA